ncbi:MAG: hypothetical protein ACOCQD_02360 [archaeon]
MKQLTEETMNIIESYLQEDKSISKLYENDVVNEDDILKLHEALYVLDEWEELLSEVHYDFITTQEAREKAKEAAKVAKRKGMKKGALGTLAAGATAIGAKKIYDKYKKRKNNK